MVYSIGIQRRVACCSPCLGLERVLFVISCHLYRDVSRVTSDHLTGLGVQRRCPAN
jgi:hypothetical protein